MTRYYLSALLLATGLAPAAASADPPPAVTVFFGPDVAPSESACPAPVTVVRRMGGPRETVTMPLLDCDGAPRPEALVAVSVLARPRERTRPTDEELRAWRRRGRPAEIAPGVRRLHPGLLRRLQRVGDAFAGRSIEILSGYRPSSPRTSRHHHGRALDLRVDGVDREALRDVAASLAQTGVGFYPNSVFVHVDVRDAPAYWVDVSQPGEAPRYVADAAPPARPPPDPASATMSDDEIERLRRDTAEALAGIVIPER